MPRKYEFDHHLPGLTIMLGVIAIAAGAVLPWIQATTLKVGIDFKVFSTETQVQQSFDGFEEGAVGVLVALLVLDALALVVAVALMATHRRRGLLWRLLAVLCAVSAGAFGAFLLVAAKQDISDLF